MAQEKDNKLGGVATASGPPRPPGRVASVPPAPPRVASVPPTPPRKSSTPPKPPSRAPAPPSSRRSSIPPSKALGRDPFPGLKPVVPVQDSVPPLQAKLASIEEISSSLLLADDGTLEEKPPLVRAPSPGASVEELSGSLLLEDPDATGAVKPIVADPRMLRPAIPRALAPDTLRPADAPDTERPPAVSERAPLAMPELPTATPPPDLSALANATPAPDLSALPNSMLPPPEVAASGGMRHLSAPPTEPFAFEPPAQRDTPSSLPTTIAWPSPAFTPAPPDATAGPAAAEGLAAGGAPSAQEPVAPMGGDVEVNALPRSSLRAARDSLRAGLHELQSMAVSPNKRPPWFIPSIAGVGLLLGVGLAAVAAVSLRKGDDQPAAAAETQHAATSATATHAAPVDKPAAPPPVQVPCIVTGQPHILANSATVAAGIEVRPFGSDVAVGFASDDHTAKVLRVDPASLNVGSSADASSTETVRRVTPVPAAADPSGHGALAAAIDADASGDALQGRRTMPLPAALELGVSGGSLWWAHPGGAAAGKLWAIEGDGPVEALRGAVETTGDATTTAIGLRHAGAVWLGAATGRAALAPRGALTRIEGLGGGVGQPAVAISDGVVLAAWADRASASDPWRLRWVRFGAGEAPGASGTFTPPAGGQGEQAMSPGVAAVPGGRFLLVWTEGPAARHDVRALTLSRDGQPIGPPLVISNQGINAGQGQAAVTSGQHGLVSFLESASGGFAVVATPIACAM